MSTPKLVLNTDLVKISDTGKEYRVHISMKEGGTLEHNPFPRDLRGLIAALDLAMNCLSGKFYPARVWKTELAEIAVARALLEDRS